MTVIAICLLSVLTSVLAISVVKCVCHLNRPGLWWPYVVVLPCAYLYCAARAVTRGSGEPVHYVSALALVAALIYMLAKRSTATLRWLTAAMLGAATLGIWTILYSQLGSCELLNRNAFGGWWLPGYPFGLAILTVPPTMFLLALTVASLIGLRTSPASSAPRACGWPARHLAILAAVCLVAATTVVGVQDLRFQRLLHRMRAQAETLIQRREAADLDESVNAAVEFEQTARFVTDNADWLGTITFAETDMERLQPSFDLLRRAAAKSDCRISGDVRDVVRCAAANSRLLRAFHAWVEQEAAAGHIAEAMADWNVARIAAARLAQDPVALSISELVDLESAALRSLQKVLFQAQRFPVSPDQLTLGPSATSLLAISDAALDVRQKINQAYVKTWVAAAYLDHQEGSLKSLLRRFLNLPDDLRKLHLGADSLSGFVWTAADNDQRYVPLEDDVSTILDLEFSWQCAVAAIAAARYELRTAAYPQQMSALRPEDLSDYPEELPALQRLFEVVPMEGGGVIYPAALLQVPTQVQLASQLPAREMQRAELRACIKARQQLNASAGVFLLGSAQERLNTYVPVLLHKRRWWGLPSRIFLRYRDLDRLTIVSIPAGKESQVRLAISGAADSRKVDFDRIRGLPSAGTMEIGSSWPILLKCVSADGNLLDAERALADVIPYRFWLGSEWIVDEPHNLRTDPHRTLETGRPLFIWQTVARVQAIATAADRVDELRFRMLLAGVDRWQETELFSNDPAETPGWELFQRLRTFYQQAAELKRPMIFIFRSQ